MRKFAYLGRFRVSFAVMAVLFLTIMSISPCVMGESGSDNGIKRHADSFKDGHGVLHMVWQEPVDGQYEIFYANNDGEGKEKNMGIGNDWNPSERRITFTPGDSVWPEVGADAIAGWVWVTWTEGTAFGGTRHYALSTDRGRSWSVPSTFAERLLLKAAAFDPLTERSGIPQELTMADDQGYFIVQFALPARQEWKTELTFLGAELYGYLPSNAYIAGMSPEVKEAVSDLPYVRWIGVYQPAYRLDPELWPYALGQGTGESIRLDLRAFEDPEVVVQTVQGWGHFASCTYPPYVRVIVPDTMVRDVAFLPQVRWLEETQRVAPANDVATDIIEADVLWDPPYMLSGIGQTIAVADSGLDTGESPGVDDDGDGLFDEETLNGVDDDGDFLIDEDLGNIDNDGDGYMDEDPVDGVNDDNDYYVDDYWLTMNGHRSPTYDEMPGWFPLTGDEIYVDDGENVGVIDNDGIGNDDTCLNNGGDGVADAPDGFTIPVAGGYLTDEDATMHPDFAGEIVAIHSWPFNPDYPDPTNTNDGADDGAYDGPVWGVSSSRGHGTHVAGSAAGGGSASAGSYRGAAYKAGLVFQAFQQLATYGVAPGMDQYHYGAGIPTDLNELFQQAYDDGARIHTNSWGQIPMEGPAVYDLWASQVDEFVWNNKDMTILFAAGNYGEDSDGDGIVDSYQSVISPAVAKNCIAVGATENGRPGMTLTYGTWDSSKYPASPISDDAMADDPNGMAAFSSRGPSADNRIKPDVVAPGSYVLSTKSSLLGPDPLGWGTYDGYYSYSTGTSMSTPLTAGAVALIREYYTNAGEISPSAALVKATVINGAFDLTPGQYPAPENDVPEWPNCTQGWGRVDVKNSIDPGVPMGYDDIGVPLFVDESRVFEYDVADDTIPLRITLAWTDCPGSEGAAKALVNDLDVIVTAPNGTIYHGNAINGVESILNPVPGECQWDVEPFDGYDDLNNVESVKILSPGVGTWTIRVYARNIDQPQDFALVVTGAQKPYPDIMMHGWNPHDSDITWEPLVWEIGDPLNVTARIWNVGQMDTGSFTVGFYRGWWGIGAPWNSEPEATKVVTNIPPYGEFVDVTLYIEHTTTKSYNADIVADIVEPYPPGEVAELDEDNNYAHRCIWSGGGQPGGVIIFPVIIWNPVIRVPVLGVNWVVTTLNTAESRLVDPQLGLWEASEVQRMSYSLYDSVSGAQEDITALGNDVGTVTFTKLGSNLDAGSVQTKIKREIDGWTTIHENLRSIDPAITVQQQFPTQFPQPQGLPPPLEVELRVQIPLDAVPGEIFRIIIDAPELHQFSEFVSPVNEMIIVVE